MGYELSRAAVEDILAAYAYGMAQFGVRQAEDYQAGLSRLLLLIGEHPEMGRVRPEFRPLVRMLGYRRHVIVYTRRPDGNVFVLRLLHGRQDIERLLADL
ncbi:MAG: plasmid stabilization protein ParE [Tistrella sp.]|uniref:Plasmid stabilization protein ParE n=1 Tax=Tistrella mobilis TaxID=171437 RepID=A0A3B9IDU3_9PROT|nr:type II toxin-antitoxin system RelE/ParE family toxin [Tistrella sp.]MAD37865.1 plasmid stabilization protein ParE [Tistrella sp.]MBA78563.1 plasmid stabilization protein ParE [Tistrella sp.]HAE45896.1 plasmid stabilization protein ParE [Tistrella mobilis]|tara:strand:+ start:1610 stop:1909 length:300 start_codon:yes stop_codon:yes gene_type:complete